MSQYIINANAQRTGEHEVHRVDTCQWLPDPQNRVPLGDHPNCLSAVATAKRRYPNASIDGCAYCCAPCHTR